MTVHTRRACRKRTRGRRLRAGARPGLRVVAVAGAVVAAVTLVGGCGSRAQDDGDPDHRTFDLHGKTLTIDSDDSALELVPVDGDEVRVTRWFSARVVLGGDPKATWSWQDDQLTLRVHCAGVVTSCSAKHRVEVPRDVAVTVRNQDGSVTARGFRTALRIHSDDGSVRVEDSAGPLELSGKDGSIRAVGLTSRRVRATTDDGSLELELKNVPDRVDTRTKDGSTTITLPRSGAGGTPVAYQVTAASKDGHVTVDVPRDEHSRHVVSAHADDGKVTVRNAN